MHILQAAPELADGRPQRGDKLSARARKEQRSGLADVSGFGAGGGHERVTHDDIIRSLLEDVGESASGNSRAHCRWICMVFDRQLCVVWRRLASEMSGGGESIVHAQQGDGACWTGRGWRKTYALPLVCVYREQQLLGNRGKRGRPTPRCGCSLACLGPRLRQNFYASP